MIVKDCKNLENYREFSCKIYHSCEECPINCPNKEEKNANEHKKDD